MAARNNSSDRKKVSLAANASMANVKAWLAGECFVREVTEGTDVGIDLYCESVHQQEPFLHFWIQVKSGEIQPKKGKPRLKINSDGTQARWSFEAKHLLYWSRQPVPVFVFLVPPAGHTFASFFYVIDLTEWLISGGGEAWLKGSGRHKVIGSHIRYDVSIAADLEEFIHDKMPKASAKLRIRDGVSSFVPVIDENSYTRVSMYRYRAPYYVSVIDQIRRTCSSTLSDLAAYEDQLPQPVVASNPVTRDQVMVFLGEWLGLYYSDLPWQEQHWEDYRAFGYLEWCRGNPVKAKEWYQKAKSTIENDPNTNTSQPGWQWAINGLDEHIRQCDSMTTNS